MLQDKWHGKFMNFLKSLHSGSQGFPDVFLFAFAKRTIIKNRRKNKQAPENVETLKDYGSDQTAI